jgi:hypothetical protein
MCIVHSSTQAISLGLMSGSIHFFFLSSYINKSGICQEAIFTIDVIMCNYMGHWCPVTSAIPAEALFLFIIFFSYSCWVFRSCSGVF